MGKLLNEFLDVNEIEFAVKVGKDILAELLQMVSRLLNSSMELDEFRDIYTKPLDRVILAEEEKTGNNFVGGEFKVFYISDKSFGVSYSLYFQNEKEKWQRMTAKSDPIDMYHLSAEAIRELSEKRTIVYDVEKPTQEARREYEESKANEERKPKRIE